MHMSDIHEKFDLNGRVAVVTGGAGLLGVEFCRTLVQAGAKVVVADQKVAAAQQVVETLKQEGFVAMAVGVDVSQPKSAQAMVTATLDSFGRLDILVNSAAMDPKFDTAQQDGHHDTFEDYPLEAWQQALDVNLTGMFLCCQAATRPMLAQGRGTIINICSIYGLVGPDQRIYQRPDQPARYKPAFYSVTKAGVLGLTRYLATYFAGRNIRVNALTPGGVYNDHDEDFLLGYSARAVLGRMAYRDEMNGAILFLSSDASSYMTGANLVVDGGWTAW
jgi:NAD(P)-dependent dehydrogenase (short-subunit alcohol dehydrogenase family)